MCVHSSRCCGPEGGWGARAQQQGKVRKFQLLRGQAEQLLGGNEVSRAATLNDTFSR